MIINKSLDWSSHTHHEEFVYPNEKIKINTLASIVIGNYNHSDETLALVKRLTDYQREDIPIEIIVSDTGSNKEQMQLLTDGLGKMEALDVAIRLVIIDKAELRKNHANIHAFSFGINAGARIADGKVLIFCDSSIITPQDFVYEMCLPHVKGNKVVVRAPLWDIKEENISFINKKEIRNTPYGSILDRIDKKILRHTMGRPAWSVQRQDFLNLHGMDEQMIYYGVTDDDFVLRMLMTEAKNWMSKSRVIHIWHPETRNTNNDFNLFLMKKHLHESTWRVNTNIEWGVYDKVIEF